MSALAFLIALVSLTRFTLGINTGPLPSTWEYQGCFNDPKVMQLKDSDYCESRCRGTTLIDR
jgi:hypothetical protein